jgi:hypothetical protein
MQLSGWRCDLSRLTDTRILKLMTEALRNGAQNIGGYVQWKNLPAEWLRKNLENQTQLSIVQRMLQHVEDGNEVDQVVEKREGHLDESRFHFDFRFRIDGVDVYIETVLRESRNEAIIKVVNMHLK